MMPTLLQFIATADPKGAARRVQRTIVDFAIAAIFLAIGIGFLMAAIFMVAAERYGATYTAFGFAGFFLVVGVIVLLIHRQAAAAAERRRIERARAAQVSSVASATAIALLPSLMKGRGLLALAVPVVAIAAFAVIKELQAKDEDDD